MTDSTFSFQDGDTSFGSFYPKNYVLAFVADDATAARAAGALQGAGFAADDIVVVSGAEVMAHDDAMRAHDGPGTRLRELWSRLYTDDSANARALVDLARRGSAAVLVYAPDDALTTRAADALRPLGPQVLRKYGAFTVTDLT